MKTPNRTWTVLIADDEVHIRAVVGVKLRGAGLVVVEARDGREAFELAALRRPDLIVTDLQMPAMSGLEMAIEMAKDPALARVPILMLTARGHIVDPRDLARTNIKEVIPKPFSAARLLERARALLGVAEPDRAARAA